MSSSAATAASILPPAKSSLPPPALVCTNYDLMRQELDQLWHFVSRQEAQPQRRLDRRRTEHAHSAVELDWENLRSGFAEAECELSKWQQRHTFLVLAGTKYEIHTIQKEKLRRMETDNEKPKYAITLEVEMQESNCSRESKTLPTKSETRIIINVSDDMLGAWLW